MEERKVGSKTSERDFQIEFQDRDRMTDPRYRLFKRKGWRDYFS